MTTTPPFLDQAVASGSARILAKSYDALAKHFYASIFVATKEYVDKNRDTMARFGRAMHESIVYTNAHLPETVDLVASYSGIPASVIANSNRATAGEYVTRRDVQPPHRRRGSLWSDLNRLLRRRPHQPDRPSFGALEVTSTGAADVIFSEALAIDERRWDDWLAHFADDCVFWVPAWRSESELTTDPDRRFRFSITIRGPGWKNASRACARISR